MADRFDVAKVAPHLVEITLRHFTDVLAAITVFRKRHVLAQYFLGSRAHRDGEVMNLLAGVVVVELARNVRALPVQEIGERIAERGLPAMTDMQGTRRVGRNKFDENALATAFGSTPEIFA